MIGPLADSAYAVDPVGVETIRPSERWLYMKRPSTSTISSTMPDTAPRETTMSFSASALKTASGSSIDSTASSSSVRARWMLPASSVRSSTSYRPASISLSTSTIASSGMSVMKPSRP